MLRPGQLIALCVLALLTLGVIMVNSAKMTADPAGAVTAESIILSRSSAYMVAALVAMGICACLPIRRLTPVIMRTHFQLPVPLASGVGVGGSSLSLQPRQGIFPGIRDIILIWLRLFPMWVIIGATLLFLALVYVPGIGRQVNGSHRWISLPVPGFESFQPSEIAKWGMIILLAYYGSKFQGRMKKFWIGLAPGLAAAGAVAAFIVKEDLGTGALIGMVSAVILVAAGARIWHLLCLAPIPLAGVVLAIVTSPYRRDRLLAFLDPYLQPETIGYHMIQSMVAIANGRIFGRGLGHGLQKFDYLPEDHTDFLFAIVCEELGVVGCLIVVSLYAVLIWNAMAIIRRERWNFLKLIGLGVIATIGIQAVINLFVVTGMGPTKGIALPLLSSGGTGWILTAASLGLLMAMDRTQSEAIRSELSEAEAATLYQQRAARSSATRPSPTHESASQEPVSVDSSMSVSTQISDEPVPVSASDPAGLSDADPTSISQPEPATHSTPAPVAGSSSITILSSPGQQGWLLSGTAAPIDKKPRVTLLTQASSPAKSEEAEVPPAPSADPSPQIVVTPMATAWQNQRTSPSSSTESESRAGLPDAQH